MVDDNVYEEASPEDKLRIASYFIMHSPNGEINEVVRDVKKLVSSDTLLSKTNIEAILREYSREQMVFAPHPTARHNVLLCPAGMLSSDVYYDPRTHTALRFDNFRRVWSTAKAKVPSVSSKIEAYRVAIEKAMIEYTEAAYLDPSKNSFAVFADNSGNITIYISAKNVNLPNFWSGGWRTTFTLNVGTKGRSPIKGSIRINVHYFEDGNVQLDSNFSREESITVESVEATAQSVHAAIDTIETVFQTKLDEFYVSMHTYTFAAMRRFLPVTRNPMDWHANAHKLAGQLKDSE